MDNFKWRIGYKLKDGNDVYGVYSGPENDSEKVAKRLLGVCNNTFSGCRNANETGSLYVRVGDVVAIEIVPFNKEGNVWK